MIEMADAPEAFERGDRWIFTEEALRQARGLAHERATRELLGAAASPGRERLLPLCLEESGRLVQLHAQRLPQICRDCSVPSDVQWTAGMFYRRFYIVQSPMEFDPLVMLLVCLHLACKVEEVHEITLEDLFDSARPFGANEAMKKKVFELELTLLEALDFALLVEPKPDAALHMLTEELLRLHPQQAESLGPEAAAAAEALALRLGLRTDAALRAPPSLAIAAALGAVVREGQGGSSAQVLETLQSLLEANAEDSGQVRGMFQAALQDIEKLSASEEATEEAMREASRAAVACHRAFERRREEAAQVHEQHRRERKRRREEMKGAGGRAVSRPLSRSLMQCLMEVNAGAGLAEAGDDGATRRLRFDIDVGHM